MGTVRGAAALRATAGRVPCAAACVDLLCALNGQLRTGADKGNPTV